MTLENIFYAWSDVDFDTSYYLYLMQTDAFVDFKNWHTVPQEIKDSVVNSFSLEAGTVYATVRY